MGVDGITHRSPAHSWLGMRMENHSAQLIQPFLFLSSSNRAGRCHPPMTSKEKYSSKINDWNLRLNKVSQIQASVMEACWYRHCFNNSAIWNAMYFNTTDLGGKGRSVDVTYAFQSEVATFPFKFPFCISFFLQRKSIFLWKNWEGSQGEMKRHFRIH